ncbi:calcium-binding protein [Labrenzia sp. 011]|uniref:EF-hand domain-containing protein n=1 Tax=Labrenzia sp. 011 TaxID=2171494 RepID=UPI000D508080|nr:calcium-binding protein [Labrenzia sp. 011]PVB61015.1 calcium-binding protein [Labrenzia sp. 011]
MKPFRKIAIAVLAASVAGTALTAGLSASAQSGPADGDGGKQIQQTAGERFAHMGKRGGGHMGKRGGRHGERIFERFDADKDGVITEAEIVEVQTSQFQSADTDGSGDISLEEFKAEFLTRTNDRMVRAFQFLDRDGDGTVTQEETDVVANRLFKMMDRDGNGTAERMQRGKRGPADEQKRAERKGPDGKGGKDGKDGKDGRNAQRAEARGHDERGGPRGPQHGRGGPGQMFLALFDTDGDGAVSREDFDARRAELFALADTDGKGSFTLEQFAPLWLTVNENRVVDMFQRADADGSLGISAEEHGKRLDKMMERADRNKDGVITKADFKGGKHGGKGKGQGHGKRQRG